MNKKVYSISSRDFCEIGFTLKHNSKYYRLSYSIEGKVAETEEFVRGNCLMNIGILKKSETGKIIQTQISAVDVKM